MSHKRAFFFLVLLLGSMSPLAWGRASCLPANPHLQVLEDLDGSAQVWTYSLYAGTAEASLDNSVFLNMNADGVGNLDLHFAFSPEFEGVSLPYNLYGILITSGNEVLAWYDFTDGCKEIPLSLFPKQKLDLKVELLNPKSRIQILVWGRL